MKGGIAGMLFALETVTRLGAKLAGDVVFCTNTDEESSGAGSQACAAHGVRADAGLCAEPTAFDVWVACRGGVNPVVRTLGRTGHAEMHHPHWREGGPVNAIDKMELVLASLRALREDWARRPEFDHPYLHRPHVLPTVIKGGEWMVTYPSSCEAVLSVVYMPGQVNGDRGGQDVFDEVEAWVKAATDQDDWLAEHPPEWEWPCDIVPAEVPDDAPIVTDALAAAADVGRPGRVSGLDSWHDAAVFTRVAGTPTVSFGPGDLNKAHTIDESVPGAGPRRPRRGGGPHAAALVRRAGVTRSSAPRRRRPAVARTASRTVENTSVRVRSLPVACGGGVRWPVDVRFLDDAGVVEMVFAGGVSPEELDAGMVAAGAAGAEHLTNRYLVDVRETGRRAARRSTSWRWASSSRRSLRT